MTKHGPAQKTASMLTLANKITIMRLLLVPAIVISLFEHEIWTALVLFSFCGLTDFLDGLVARRRDEKTRLGAFLDPLADKLLLTAVYLTLTVQNVVEVWLFVVIFSRDLLIILGWVLIYILTDSAEIRSRWLGKTATALQMTAAVFFMVGTPPTAHRVLVWTIFAFTIASVIDYIRVAERRLVGEM